MQSILALRWDQCAACRPSWNGLDYVLFGFGTKAGMLGIANTAVFGPEVAILGLAVNTVFAGALSLWRRRLKRSARSGD